MGVGGRMCTKHSMYGKMKNKWVKGGREGRIWTQNPIRLIKKIEEFEQALGSGKKMCPTRV